MRFLLPVLLFLFLHPLMAGNDDLSSSPLASSGSNSPPRIPARTISKEQWDFLLPSEKALLTKYQNLTPEELKSLTPSDYAAADAKKAAAIARVRAAAEEEWCGEHPVECTNAAKSTEPIAEGQAQLAAEKERSAITQKRPSPRPIISSETSPDFASRQVKEFEKRAEERRHVEDAVEEFRRHERDAAEIREAGRGGVTTYSSSYYSRGVDDPALQRRIETAVDLARVEERNNESAKSSGGMIIHSSAGTFDPESN